MPLRVLYQLCREIGDDKDLLQHSQDARAEKGCLESSCYRGFENREDVAIVELWEDEYAYSAHWAQQVRSESAFATVLRSSGTRTLGTDGFEFYRQQYFGNVNGVWTPPEIDGRSSVVAWPGGRAVRIIGQHTRLVTDTFLRTLIDYMHETCREPGCLQFEHFRSIEFESDTMTLELWEDQIIYDHHWKLRRLMQASGARLAAAGEAERPPRAHGTNGYEYYQCVPYKHLYDHWLPVDINQWSETVVWTM